MKVLFEKLEGISIDPKYLLSIAHKADHVLAVWWYNPETGELRTAPHSKLGHLSKEFGDVDKDSWLRGRAFKFSNKNILIAYGKEFTPERIWDIVDKLSMQSNIKIDSIIDHNGVDLFNILESK